MKMTPVKIKDLTQRLQEKGNAQIAAKVRAATKDPNAIKRCKIAFDLYKAIPKELRPVLSFAKFSSVSELVGALAKQKYRHLTVRWNNSLRSEVQELAMKSKDEYEFMKGYAKINPFR